MGWSYSGDPSTTDLDLVRFLSGDTDEQDPYLQDAELQFLLDAFKTPRKAAPHACAAILSKLSRQVDYYLGPERVFASQRVDNYRRLMDTLRALWIGENAAPSFEAPTTESSAPLFDIGMHDIKGGGLRGPSTS
jgi:hypothetical protein